MTDINEIIGRALLALETPEGCEGMAMDSGWDERGRIMLDGAWLYTDIGAAVVKALGEAGYAVAPKEPTEAMTAAAYDAGLDIYWGYRADDRPGGPEDVYRAMIGAV
jgi:hypothetical protein